MIGAQGFRAREATANYKRRDRKLVSDEVRAIRFANLHGNVAGDAKGAEKVVAETAVAEKPAAEDAAGDETAQTKGKAKKK